ncbi:MAG: type II toxin-antitoxin system RelE/ParE family toxin [Planctomycetaceae bacterium]|nr:type II toxin-antitoxin system RelE/ParE family toxin [Planctomycetaceae bacterium]
MAAIVWAPRALDDLEALVDYISRDSVVRAKRFALRLIVRVDALSSLPESGSWLPEDDGQRYRQIFQGAYRVIYRYENDIVLIVAVHHAARLFTGEDL